MIPSDEKRRLNKKEARDSDFQYRRDYANRCLCTSFDIFGIYQNRRGLTTFHLAGTRIPYERKRRNLKFFLQEHPRHVTDPMAGSSQNPIRPEKSDPTRIRNSYLEVGPLGRNFSLDRHS